MVRTAYPFPQSRLVSRAPSSAIRELLTLTERPEVISLAGGLPSPGAFPVGDLAAAVAEVLAEEGALQYSTTNGIAPLRAWIGERHGADPDRVVVTHGSQQALDLIARVTLDPGDTVALADPGYIGAIQAFRLAGGELLGVPGDREGMDVDALAGLLGKGTRPKLVYIVANFDNPTGATLAGERRRALAALADRYGFLIVEDDPYGHLRWAGASIPPVAAWTDRVVSLGTFSKILAPGLRIGYLVAPQPVADAVILVKQGVDLHTSTLGQRATHRLVSRPGFLDAHLARLRVLYERQAAALGTALRRTLGERVAFDPPEGGMFIWARLAGVDTGALLARSIEQGVGFVPGGAFSVAAVATAATAVAAVAAATTMAAVAAVTAPHRDSLRLSFATATPTDLEEAVRRLARAL
jgi:2-aminoadipate transaminase